jgi:Raf kinase inhibitor-like YbhB/YbcL family protein
MTNSKFQINYNDPNFNNSNKMFFGYSNLNFRNCLRFGNWLLGFLAIFFLVGGAAMAFELKSAAFEPNGKIASKYSCQGEDVSPQLNWQEPPQGTKSFALICDDPDAPFGDWVHWVIYNIPSNSIELREALSVDQVLPDGSIQGVNGFGKIGYGGPCPPPGKPHRYFFKLYALDTDLSLAGKVTKAALLKAIEKHILAQTELMGTYQRS